MKPLIEYCKAFASPGAQPYIRPGIAGVFHASSIVSFLPPRNSTDDTDLTGEGSPRAMRLVYQASTSDPRLVGHAVVQYRPAGMLRGRT